MTTPKTLNTSTPLQSNQPNTDLKPLQNEFKLSPTFKHRLKSLPAATWRILKRFGAWLLRACKTLIRHVLIWVITSWAIFKDRRQSVTTNPLIARLMFGRHREDDGIFLTYAPAVPLIGLKPRKLTYADDRHAFLSGGTRAGKGVSFIVPNLLQHRGSVIVFDPSGENFALTGAYRQQVLGQKVHVLDPFGITGVPSASWNPLLEIDFEEDQRALDKCFSMAESLIEMQGKDQYWTQSAQELLAMCCAYIGLRSIPENMHLPQVYALLQNEDLEPLWTAMSHCEGVNGAVGRYGSACLSRDTKEFSGVIQTLRTALRFINTPSMNDNLSCSTFSMKSLKDGNTSIYLVMPAGAGDTYRNWLRLLFDGAFDAMQDMSIPTPDIPTLFLLDEFPILGRMERIERAIGEAAKFGVKLFVCVQDLNQMIKIYGETWETFIGGCGLTIMFANNDLVTQRYLSEKLGKELYAKRSSTSSKDGGSTTTSFELRDVARADQVARSGSRITETAYFLTPDTKPMHLRRSPYYKFDMIPDGLVFEPEMETSTPLSSDTALTQAAE